MQAPRVNGSSVPRCSHALTSMLFFTTFPRALHDESEAPGGGVAGVKVARVREVGRGGERERLDAGRKKLRHLRSFPAPT